MSRVELVLSTFLVGIFCIILAGCERSSGGGEVESKGEVQSEEWPEDPQRLVSMAPNITEALFALGYGDRVVGVTRYCDYPPEVQDLPKIGGMLDPDLEAILVAQPDLVLGDIQGADHRIAGRLDRAGIAYGFLEMSDVDEVRAGLLKLGSWLGDEGAAKEVVGRFDRSLSEVSEQIQGARVGGERALLVYDHEPLVAAGPGTFGDDLLSLMGLENALKGSERAYPVLDVEALIGLDPDLILDVGTGRDGEAVQRFWGSLRGVRALEGGQIIYLDDPVLGRPGPRLPEALELLGAALEELPERAEAR